ncbi:MAG: TAT-variant-translocated molybdopterin oxidoreductase [Bryobacteraceae bacterium]|nr:TAT-variant-translocated molybdopterin oxidoreductase [Bryobacteraceae bacterium]
MNPSASSRGPVDFDSLRELLARSRGREYWRSLEELAQTPQFRRQLENEFPPGILDAPNALNRRRLLQLMGASLGLAGLSACTRQPPEKIVPYVRAPEEFVPGRPLYYATGWAVSGVALGVLVESHMGRPTKVEGNPEHPGSLGATDAFAQASILSLYDPDRAKVVMRLGRISGWVNFLAAVEQERERLLARRGAGFWILTETVTSPTLAAQLGKLLAQFPEARWRQYEPVGNDSARQGAILAFGQPANTIYRFRDARVVLSLDADFLGCGPGSVRYARDFIAGRRPEGAETAMNRLYVVEPAPSVTGSMADHRLPATNAGIDRFARALAARLGIASPGADESLHGDFLAAVAGDLRANAGASVVVAGAEQPASVHALAHAMNQALGNTGKTVLHTDPLEAQPADQAASLRELAEEMAARRVDTLLILGGNPVYTAPADLQFRERLDSVRLRIHSSLYEEETSELCHWSLPEVHPYESWGDARAYDGAVTLMQPLVAPLYAGKSPLEIVAAFNGEPSKTDRDLVREYWQGQRPGGDFESFWNKSVHDGFIEGSALPAKSPPLNAGFAAGLPAPPQDDGIEVSIRPDPTIWDGRFANNGWLQELPKPVTKLTWDNPALVSPALAERLQLRTGDVITINLENRSVRAPVWILPGHADQAVTVHLGYGRTRGGHIAAGAGFNAYPLRTSTRPWSASGARIEKTGRRVSLACTQNHHSMEGRPLVRAATLEEFRKEPDFAQHMGHEPDPSHALFPVFQYEGYKWGMSIDLNACTGCSACVIACQAENNIPVVGRNEVIRGREMHWIRVDRYFSDDLDNPAIHTQPIPCMHCETAPCEVVCPVNATVHSGEGLNQMVYNRCVGTRYCANNCPYKVRRFNFYLYADWDTPSLKLLRNPDVTVRSRGVMEKCTYCVQRINAARIESEKEDRAIRDGDIVPACAQACPTQAIVFGDLNDPSSRVAGLSKDPRNYGILTELNTRPRTTYLARLRNPNPALEKG